MISRESINLQKDLQIKKKREEANNPKSFNEFLTDKEKAMIEKRAVNQIKPTQHYVEINGKKIDAYYRTEPQHIG